MENVNGDQRWSPFLYIAQRWPAAEPIIMKNPLYAYYYARDVIGDRWPEAEPVIMKDYRASEEYKSRFGMA